MGKKAKNREGCRVGEGRASGKNRQKGCKKGVLAFGQVLKGRFW